MLISVPRNWTLGDVPEMPRAKHLTQTTFSCCFEIRNVLPAPFFEDVFFRKLQSVLQPNGAPPNTEYIENQPRSRSILFFTFVTETFDLRFKNRNSILCVFFQEVSFW